MHDLTKYLAIPQSVKKRVWERDAGKCVLCGTRRMTNPNAHYIARSQLGLGIDERNIFTACWPCHEAYDNSEHRHAIKEQLRAYLQGRYGENWVKNEDELKYHKGQEYIIKEFEYEQNYIDW